MREPDFSGGLIPAIVQDARTGEVLMLAYMNELAYRTTQDTRQAHFWSRSRQQLWRKGETSGHVLDVVNVSIDCDGDTVLLQVVPAGPACHTGSRTCFDEQPERHPAGFRRLDDLWDTIQDRAHRRPEGSYTTRLLNGGVDTVGRKVLEEAAELVEAAVAHDRKHAPVARIAEETADLLYHALALLAERDLDPGVVVDVLEERAR